MRADKGHEIQDAKDALTGIQEELKDLSSKVDAAQKESQAYQTRIRVHKTQKAALQQQMNVAQGDMDRLEDDVQTTVPDTEQLGILEKELKELDDQLRFNSEQLTDQSAASKAAGTRSRVCLKALETATKTVKEFEEQNDKLKSKVNKLTHKREQALCKKNEAIEQVELAEQSKTENEQKRDEVKVSLDVHIEDASKVCQRVEVPPGATFEYLMAQRDARRRVRADLEKELGGSQQELQAKANEAKKSWNDARKYVEDVTTLRNTLTLALKNRKERWKHFRDDISVRARVTFNYLLAERRFRGQLQVDHSKKALEMGIQPDRNVGDGATRQTKTLSGGEKSFSTICLLLALWDAMGSPIRCLDEFDVFMDSVNRDISMEMIITAARRAVGRQYILITPQAMNNKSVKTMTDVTVIKMSDPERGQTALNFSK